MSSKQNIKPPYYVINVDRSGGYKINKIKIKSLILYIEEVYDDDVPDENHEDDTYYSYETECFLYLNYENKSNKKYIITFNNGNTNHKEILVAPKSNGKIEFSEFWYELEDPDRYDKYDWFVVKIDEIN